MCVLTIRDDVILMSLTNVSSRICVQMMADIPIDDATGQEWDLVVRYSRLL